MKRREYIGSVSLSIKTTDKTTNIRMSYAESLEVENQRERAREFARPRNGTISEVLIPDSQRPTGQWIINVEWED